jgi:hypothetical protein
MGDSRPFQTCATCDYGLTELNYQAPCPRCGGMDRKLAAFDVGRFSDDTSEGEEQRQDATVSASAAMLSIAPSASIHVTIKTHFWLLWSEIALEREVATGQARWEVEQVRKQGGNYAEPLGRELPAAMVAIVASAFAIDAFYGAVKPVIPIPQETWQKNNTPRQGQVFETLKRGFSFGKAGMHWAKELKWLFNKRSAAVHFAEKSQEPQLHPIGDHTAPEQIEYSLEATHRALNLLMEILDTCSRTPRASLPDLETQMLAFRPVIERLMTERLQGLARQRPS